LGQNEGDNQTVQTERLAENENQNHADKEFRLLSVRAHTGVADNTNSEAGGQRRETARQTGGEVGKAVEARVRRLDCNREKDGKRPTSLAGIVKPSRGENLCAEKMLQLNKDSDRDAPAWMSTTATMRP
jgi:hypothetical protein